MPRLRDTINPSQAWQPFEPTAAQPWDRRAAAHLFRRAAFGAKSAQLDAAVKKPPAAVVDELLNDGRRTSADSLLPNPELADSILATNDAHQLAAWWLYVMLSTPTPLVERMTLFWHGHFATSAEKVTDAHLMLNQNELLRQHALGDFRPLVQAISRDPAMLLYLDSATNRKAHPNENYARELMELFCLGEGHYTEKDVQELARCFTGWEIKLGKFRFNRFQYDPGPKTVLGKSASFEDGASIDWILTQPQAAEFIVEKLYCQFVCDEPEPTPELLAPLVAELQEHGWQIAAVVRKILSSRLFFSPRAIGRKVRSPVDLAIGVLRSLEGTVNAHQLAADLELTGQGLFYPPNVKGWEGGRSWINSATIFGRTNMMTRVLSDEKTRFAGHSLDEYFEQVGVEKPSGIVDLLSDLLLAVPISAPARNSLIQVCSKPADRARRIRDTVQALVALPEFQLG